MTSARRAETNRMLGEFEFPDGAWGRDKTGPDYTADLNALARLEARLPVHNWRISVDSGVNVGVILGTSDDFCVTTTEQTETEARAEAIAQYLGSRSR